MPLLIKLVFFSLLWLWLLSIDSCLYITFKVVLE
ncbi:hypothetical protein TFUB20_00174 [Tannerella forsythia]|uniref:Uncharacterized protein n=1 Tax=Tannerella forsythia TaxID=28112 RepID=A0A1D3UCR1_TANFO|nr:hypothetical protein TFUB20_00174 [Tannerella forsythia]